MTKILFYDLETGGLNHSRHGIHELAAIYEEDGDVVKRLHVQANPWGELDPSALIKCGVTESELRGRKGTDAGIYLSLAHVLNQHIDRFDRKDKAFRAGYNICGFDNGFLSALFDRNGDRYLMSYFWAGSLDVMVLAAEYLRPKVHELKDFKLGTVCRAVGIEFDDSQAHGALYDVTKTRELYGIVSGRVGGGLW